MNLQRQHASKGFDGDGGDGIDPGGPHGRVAVIDIGSSSVRMVVYDTPARLPVPLFNEKADCGLVKELDKTGVLNPDGVARAYAALARFILLARTMGVDRMELVATAATRDAADGMKFVQEIERRFNVSVQVPSGPEEARLAALGLLSGVPDADGVLGDMGGGSLDLVALDKGEFGANATLPLGHTRLADAAQGSRKKGRQIVEREIGKLPWLTDVRGRTLYAVGGSWRTFAKIYIEQTAYPIHVIDGFTMSHSDARHLAKLMSGLSESSLEKMESVSRRRMETLPYAAMAFEHLIDVAQPEHIVFSGFGMREGQLIKALPAEIRAQDPLVAGCLSLSEKTGRFSLTGDELMAWTAPLFKKETAARARLRHVAALLSDLGWTEHPDYRAEHAFYRVLRLPYAGLTHTCRALLALVTLIRYNGDKADAIAAPVLRLLDDELVGYAESLGLALRLAHTISGSAPGVLGSTKLQIKDDKLILKLPKKEREVFASETVERRLRTLAKSFNLQGEFG